MYDEYLNGKRKELKQLSTRDSFVSQIYVSGCTSDRERTHHLEINKETRRNYSCCDQVS